MAIGRGGILPIWVFEATVSPDGVRGVLGELGEESWLYKRGGSKARFDMGVERAMIRNSFRVVKRLPSRRRLISFPEWVLNRTLPSHGSTTLFPSRKTRSGGPRTPLPEITFSNLPLVLYTVSNMRARASLPATSRVPKMVRNMSFNRRRSRRATFNPV